MLKIHHLFHRYSIISQIEAAQWLHWEVIKRLIGNQLCIPIVNHYIFSADRKFEYYMLHESWNVIWSRCTDQFITLQKKCALKSYLNEYVTMSVLFCRICLRSRLLLLLGSRKNVRSKKTMAKGRTSNKTFISMGENMSSAGQQRKLSMIVVGSFDLSVLTWWQQW